VKFLVCLVIPNDESPFLEQQWYVDRVTWRLGTTFLTKKKKNIITNHVDDLLIPWNRW
jgi:hypothetical protein